MVEEHYKPVGPWKIRRMYAIRQIKPYLRIERDGIEFIFYPSGIVTVNGETLVGVEEMTSFVTFVEMYRKGVLTYE